MQINFLKRVVAVGFVAVCLAVGFGLVFACNADAATLVATPLSQNASLETRAYTLNTYDGKRLSAASAKANTVIKGAKASDVSNAQRFEVKVTGAYAKISKARTSSVFTKIASPDASSEATVVLQSQSSTQAANQKWQIISSGDGYLYIKDKEGAYLSHEASSSKLTIVQTTNPGTAEKFRLKPATYWSSGNKKLDSKIAKTLKSIGVKTGGAKKIYKWVAQKCKYKHMSDAAPKGKWVNKYAAQMLKGRKGNCYRFAAVFAVLANAAGYNAKPVYGSVKTESGSDKHGWTEIKIGKVIYTYDLSFARSYKGTSKFYYFYKKTYAKAHLIYKKA